MQLESTFFKIEIDGPVAHLIMNRPDKANSMTPDFWDDLPRLTRALDRDPAIRAMVISGEGKHFSSGMDLSGFDMIMELLDAEPARAAYALRELILRFQDTFTALEQARFPVIAAIHGACVGGGIDLITACDIRLSTRDAFFSIEEIHIGMTADVGTLQRLPKLIAPGIARELAFTGRRFSAGEAHAWGLCNMLLEDKKSLLDAAFAMANDIAGKSPLAIAGIKQVSNFARDHTVADGLDQIATWNSGMLRPQDLMAAIEAKKQRKQVVFKDLLQSGN